MTFTIALLFAPALAPLAAGDPQQQNEPQQYQAQTGYQRAMRLLDERRYEQAAKVFAELAAQKGKDAEGALYWQAFSQAKIGELQQALGALETLQSQSSKDAARWKVQAAALALELRSKLGWAGSRDTAKLSDDDQLRLLALDGLMQTDPDKALPAIEKVLAGSAAPAVKERALFLLTQSGNPKSRELLIKAARDNSNPDLQIRAIRMLGFLDQSGSDLLGGLYNESLSQEARLNLLRAMMIRNDRARLVGLLKSEKDSGLRREVVRQLGLLGEKKELASIYASEIDAIVRREILQALAMTKAVDEITAALRTEKDPAVKARGVQSLGMIGKQDEKATALLTEFYAAGTPDVKRAAMDALLMQGNVKVLADLARKETDPEMKRRLVQRLAAMRSKEANDLFLELLNK
jgi:HEAT repeat protein